MTVAELRKRLDGLDPRMPVVVNHESDGDMELFEILTASPATGDPSRNTATGKAAFKFDQSGRVTWRFIAVDGA